MNAERLNPYQAHKKRIAFIEKAVGEGVLDRIPVSERVQNIALVYYLNEEITGTEVGKAFPQPSGRTLGRESVKQKGRKFLREAHNTATSQLQAEYPLAELLTRKPPALSKVTARIKRAVETGGISLKDIENTEGRSALKQARRTLRKQGIEIPRIRITYEDLKKKVDAENDDRKLQEILDSFHPSSLIRLLVTNADHKTLTTVSGIAREKGFWVFGRQVKFIAEKIKAAGIPIRKTAHSGKNGNLIGYYYIVYAKHAERIAEALREILGNDPDL